MGAAAVAPRSQFQFTPLREGRRCSRFACNPRHTISIHAPPRGATYSPFLPASASAFQFTPLREGRQKNLRKILKKVLFQFTPLREGRLHDVRGCWNRRISIHAPPRGATTLPITHTLRPLFQFTPLREGRPCLRCFGLTLNVISIHAPPRGATRISGILILVIVFQFTPLREGRRLPADKAFLRG